MNALDSIGLALESLRGHRLRTTLSGIAVAIGATAVLLLTSLGDAAKAYVTGQFAGLGSNLVTITRGRVETTGGMPIPIASTRDLTLADCDALRLRVRGVLRVVPMALASGAVEYEDRRRDVYVLGVTEPYLEVRQMQMAVGRFLPPGDLEREERVVVLGDRVKRELFGSDNPIGRSVRVSRARFRVIGVLAPKGRSTGFDLDDMVYAPAGTILTLFDQASLTRVLVQARDADAIPRVKQDLRAVLIDRHREEDFTLATPDAMLKSFRSILDALTLALAGIAAISFAVAGIGIMNVMLVAVSERVTEVGLLKALGAHPGQISRLFLLESLLISGLGALLGVAAGLALAALARRLFPVLPLHPAAWWIAVVLLTCLLTGGVFGLAPARRAARLPAAAALQGRR